MLNRINYPYRFKTVFAFLSGLIFFLAMATKSAIADSQSAEQTQPLQLSVKPRRCVALHQGQVCYQHANLTWNSTQAGNYCLYYAGNKDPLNCWVDAREGTFAIEFKAAESQKFQIRGGNLNSLSAETELIVAWVYENKKRGRASWRLF